MPHTLKVLLVEDEYLVAMHTEDMLSDLGYEVQTVAATLEAGLKAAMTGGFDLAVLDVNLRGSMSFPIADILSERGIPFLFASGYAGAGMEPRHADAVRIQKPYTSDILEIALKQVIAQVPYA